jgi:hypothetical protein
VDVRGIWSRLQEAERRDALPLADVASLVGIARRTRLVRLALGLALVACAAAAFVSVPRPEGRRFLPSTTVTIVVLDLSSSIRPQSFQLIHQTLQGLIGTGGRFGVVLYSDVAYEALPPGTPASELTRFARFFAEENAQRVAADGIPIPRTPWEQWFSAGTNISAGLRLAARQLQEAHVENGGVALFSDLADDPNDLTSLAETIALYVDRKLPLRVIALDPAPENLAFFQELLAGPGLLSDVRLPKPEVARGALEIQAPFPTRLALIAGALILLLAWNEWYSEPVRWPRRRAA